MNISFDYDGTLDDHFDGSKNPYKYKVRDKLLELSKSNNIFIITKRYGKDSSWFYNNVYNEIDKVYKLADELGVNRSNIFFTNREIKLEQLVRNKIDMHFDDDLYELLIYKNVCNVINVKDI